MLFVICLYLYVHCVSKEDLSLIDLLLFYFDSVCLLAFVVHVHVLQIKQSFVLSRRCCTKVATNITLGYVHGWRPTMEPKPVFTLRTRIVEHTVVSNWAGTWNLRWENPALGQLSYQVTASS